MWEDLKFIDTQIEKPGHGIQQQFKHRLTVRNCVIIYRYQYVDLRIAYCVLCCMLYWTVLIREESTNERYYDTVKDLLLLNIVSQKDEKPHTAGLNDTVTAHI